MDWTWYVTFAAATGALVNATGRLGLASAIWLCTNTCWAFVDFKAGLYAQFALYLFFIATSVYGIWTSWQSKKKRSEHVYTYENPY